METHILSKSTFMRGLQCTKSLMLYKLKPELKDEISEKQQEVFSRGTDIGMLARELFPGGVDASPETSYQYQESVILTKSLIDKGEKVIYEATFQHEKVMCALDILVKDKDGWKGYEVKSGTGVHEVYFTDCSLQNYIITESGIDLVDFFIVNINNQYIRSGDIDIHSLFNIESIFSRVNEKRGFIQNEIVRLKNVVETGIIPEIDIGEHCNVPYQCDFSGHCWSHIPDDSVFDVSNLKSPKKFELYGKGIILIKDIPDDYPLSSKQRIQINSHINNTSVIDKEKIQDFVQGIHYPIYFLDFETFNPALPLFDGSRPYQQITFQYSLHYKKSKKSRLKHYEFLGEPGKDPRKEFIIRLIKDLWGNGDILVYNKSFESGRLKELARDFPEYSLELENIILRIKDLMIPFQNKWYYTPDMKGSYSIKAVLPILVPDLSYNNLSISNGGMAMNAYEELQYIQNTRKTKRIIRHLLAYCKMDTLGMVRIFEVLEGDRQVEII